MREGKRIRLAAPLTIIIRKKKAPTVTYGTRLARNNGVNPTVNTKTFLQIALDGSAKTCQKAAFMSPVLLMISLKLWLK